MARNPRFRSGPDQKAQSFTASVTFDWRLLPYDIAGSQAHVAMLGRQGVISAEDAEIISRGLQQVLEEAESGVFEPRLEHEDVHMNVEARLSEIIGPVAGKLHTGRSRNDQVALDMHLYMRAVAQRQQRLLLDLMEAIVHQAEANSDVIMPGYTHLQAAQPVLWAHHMMAYVAMLRRDMERILSWAPRVVISPLGAGAISGTPYPTDPLLVAHLVGFDGVYQNSMDAVADRDFLLEYLSWASILMVHLSRLGEELVLWSTQEFGFVTMADAYSTGSSLMPQKRNPDVAELMRGKSGRVFGNLMTLLTVMKGLPLAYHSDMQEDKEAVFDVVDTLDALLPVAAGMMETLSVRQDRLNQRVGHDYTAATDLADMLVGEGMPFREAHHLVGSLVTRLEQDGLHFADVTPEYLAEVAPSVPFEWMSQLAAPSVVKRRRQPMSTGPEFVHAQVDAAKGWIAQLRQIFSDVNE
ncbi:MAG: argininosuccinate lyase [Sulfobacillus benefaciens]|uniref:Argininosuccinate lyase n=1 Tax=Sulfobacillus benefaciens TaxID=453960 RepID=A0A2T2XM47_9FIRM|nr:MAG: argininosuccinate lyase [Sulfobacillus benefaciens]